MQHVPLVVFAAETKQHARIHLTDHEFLQGAIRWSHFDSRGTVLAAYSFPKRVVAVQHDHFKGVSFQVEDGSDERGPNRSVTFWRVRDMTHMVTMFIVIVVDRVAAQQRRRAYTVDIRYSSSIC